MNEMQNEQMCDLIKNNSYKFVFDIEVNLENKNAYIKKKKTKEAYKNKEFVYANLIFSFACKLISNLQAMGENDYFRSLTLISQINEYIQNIDTKIDKFIINTKSFTRKKVCFMSEFHSAVNKYTLNYKGFFLGGMFYSKLPEYTVETLLALIQYVAIYEMPYEENKQFWHLISLGIQKISTCKISYSGTVANIKIILNRNMMIPMILGTALVIFPQDFMKNAEEAFKRLP